MRFESDSLSRCPLAGGYPNRKTCSSEMSTADIEGKAITNVPCCFSRSISDGSEIVVSQIMDPSPRVLGGLEPDWRKKTRVGRPFAHRASTSHPRGCVQASSVWVAAGSKISGGWWNSMVKDHILFGDRTKPRLRSCFSGRTYRRTKSATISSGAGQWLEESGSFTKCTFQ